VFAHGDCDLLVDTTAASPSVAGDSVVAMLAAPPRRTAFDRLRER
jgi:hypothetical protein